MSALCDFECVIAQSEWDEQENEISGPFQVPGGSVRRKIAMQIKSQNDMYGFLWSAEYMEAERESWQRTSQAVAQRDLAQQLINYSAQVSMLWNPMK